MFSASILSVLAFSVASAFGFDLTRSDNLVVYYGQNSYGALNPSDTANWQKTISTYCQDDIINVIPIAFVDVFFSTGGLPDLNMANICNPTDDGAFPGTSLANCQFLASQIQACQAAGKIITISLGGASGAAVLTSDAQGVQLANTIWNLFLGGTSSTRPFGAAVLDGVDLDIEGGGPTGFAAFVTQIRTLSAGASKKYYVTAAPQCPFPDAWIGSVLNAVAFDAVFVQFYNNFCSVANFPNAADWDFSQWDTWAKTVSPNKNVKIFIGAPAAPSAGAGYVPAATLGQIALTTRAQSANFGGIMLWDASQAYANSRFDRQIKSIITTAGGGATTTSTRTTSTTTPPVTSSTKTSTSVTSTKTSTSVTSTTTVISGGSCAGVAAWVSTIAYVGGSQVTFNGHLWQANWWSEADVPGGASGDWSDLGPCTSLAAATAKVDTIPAAAATVTGAVRVTPAASPATAAAAVEMGKGKRGSRVFRL